MKRGCFRLFAASFFCFCSVLSFSQSTYLPSSSSVHQFLERIEVKSGKHASQFHSILKPLERKAAVGFIEQQDTQASNLTHVDKALIELFLQKNPEWAKQKSKTSKKPLLKHFYIFPSDFYRYQGEEFFLTINPVLDLRVGQEANRRDFLFLNTRGVEARGMINNKVGFYTFIAENQARFPFYVNQQMQWHKGAVPGEGWTKDFKNQGVDFFSARGYLAFQATRNIGLQFGNDRNFIGNGIRSLLLSSYANNYLFLKVNTRYKWFHYQNIFAGMIDYPMRSFSRTYDKKYSVTHFLNINVHPKFQLGLFENVIFGRNDTLNPRNFELHYLNPVIFYRAIEHHLGDSDKVSVGMNWQWIAGKNLALYGQIYVDEFYLQDIRNDVDSILVRFGLRQERKYENFASFRNKFAMQLGIKTFDLFSISDLDVQAEINLVRPFVYSHYDTSGNNLPPANSYSHYSQPLAHPLGANFREWAVRIAYRPHPRWEIISHFFSMVQGKDTTGINSGGDILRDYRDRQGDYNHFFLQGDKHSAILGEINLLWQFWPGWFADLRWLYRHQKHEAEPGSINRTEIISLGLRANISARKYFF